MTCVIYRRSADHTRRCAATVPETVVPQRRLPDDVGARPPWCMADLVHRTGHTLGNFRRGMRVLVWQWGRRGAGPRFAVALADALGSLPGTEAVLSLSTGAEILHTSDPPECRFPMATYSGVAGLTMQWLRAPLIITRLIRRLAALRPDLAICAMPGPLDLMLLAALRWHGVPSVVIVHDADPHPGDTTPFLMFLQRRLIRRAEVVAALSRHVAARLLQQRLVDPDRLFTIPLPPFVFGPPPPPPRAHGGPLRLLCFGRLLPYKGLDLLADAIRRLEAQPQWELRVVGSGPETEELAALRALPGVTVENRWVPEDEIAALIAWCDALVLPYREASQSGVAPAVIAAGRFVVSTRVGGLAEQLDGASLATLCEPDAASLATALRALLHMPLAERGSGAPANPSQAWRDMAERLLSRAAPRDRGASLVHFRRRRRA
jgi:glycosyltransferase involved in cell wall biosynthesis